MKRIISLFLIFVLSLLMLSGCSSDKKVKIELTSYNWSKYLTFTDSDANLRTGRTEPDTDGKIKGYSCYDLSVEVKPTKEEYVFENAKISFKVSYGYSSTNISLKLDENGYASKSETIYAYTASHDPTDNFRTEMYQVYQEDVTFSNISGYVFVKKK